MKNSIIALAILASFTLVTPAQTIADIGDFFSGLNVFGGNNDNQTQLAEKCKVGPYTILGEPTVHAHNHFERELDGPNFYNFTSIETSISGMKRINHGVCYGISMFTNRYFQWFILPHLLSDEERVKAGPHRIPAYGKKIAEDFELPEWVTAPIPASCSESQEERAAKIRPYRLRLYMSRRRELTKALEAKLVEERTKEHAMRMFDNQMLLIRKGTQLAGWLDKKMRKGQPAFDQFTRYIKASRVGVAEVGFWGSTTKELWGHSVVGYKMLKYKAREGDNGDLEDAYQLLLYDSNDPRNTSDNCFWYFPEKKLWAPSKQYGDFYDGSNPLIPAGKQFLGVGQMGPGTDVCIDSNYWVPTGIQKLQGVLRFEENFFNHMSIKYNLETVEEEGNRGR